MRQLEAVRRRLWRQDSPLIAAVVAGRAVMAGRRARAWRRGKDRHLYIDNCHCFSYIMRVILAHVKGPAAKAYRGTGARAVPAGGIASRTRAASGISWPALRPVR